jgi:hypothetical protein
MPLADCEGRATDDSVEIQPLGLSPRRECPAGWAARRAPCPAPGAGEGYPPMEATSRRVSARW